MRHDNTALVTLDIERKFARFAERLGRMPKIAYVSGPGDLCKTYEYWVEGRVDPDVPVYTYSAQFFDLVTRLGCIGQIITLSTAPKNLGRGFVWRTVNRRRWNTSLQYFLSSFFFGIEVIKEIRLLKPDFIVLTTDFPAFFWRLIAKSGPVILSVHNAFWTIGRPPVSWRSRLRLKILEHESDAISGAVCVSPSCRRQLSVITAGRIDGAVWLPQITAPANFRASIEKPQRILYIGRIEREKGVFLLRDAFLSLAEEDKSFALTVIGEGSSLSLLRQSIVGLGLDNVSILGRQDAAAIVHQLSTSDLVVVPTMPDFPEGLAVVAFEAANQGVPCVLSSAVPAAEVLEGGCEVFEAGEEAALTGALRRMLGDRRLFTQRRESLLSIVPLLHDRRRSWATNLAAEIGRVINSYP